MSDFITLFSYLQDKEMTTLEILLIGAVFILLWRIPDIIRALKE